MSPDTQEMFVFNMYGQHSHTIDIHTGLYMYNFTYNVFASYGRLAKVSGSGGRSGEGSGVMELEVKRNYQQQAQELRSPGGQRVSLRMDTRHRLAGYVADGGDTATFTYTEKTGNDACCDE